MVMQWRNRARVIKQSLGKNPVVFHSYQLLFRVLLEPRNKGQRLKFLNNYMKWFLVQKPRGEVVQVTLDNGMKSRVHPDSDSGVAYLFNQNVDYLETKFIRESLAAGDFIVDAGCNVGNRTLALADIVSGGLLLDANPNCVSRARENLELNGLPLENFNIRQCAVGETECEVEFPDDSGTSCQNQISDGAQSGNTIKVQMVTLDSLLESMNNPPVAFLKTDLEGYDLAALKGANKLLSSDSLKLVFFERWPSSALSDFIDYFASHGWEVFALDKDGRPDKQPQLLTQRKNLFARRVTNT